MSTETSILLPTASVHLYLKDRPTIAAAQALSNDWRFARVNIRVTEGDVETAIAHYAQTPSPEIVLVETDTTDSSFIGRLDALSGYCNEKTSAVVIGPVNDVNLYRSLTALGVSDYLVFPVPQDTLAEVIAGTLIEKLGTAGSRLVAVIGAKGGVGTSALAQALAWGSAENLGQKTFLLDMAGAWTSLPVGIGYEPSASTAEAIKAAVAKDQDSLRRMIYAAHERLFVLATGMEPMLESSPHMAQFEEVLNVTMSSHPVVIADLSGAPAAVQKMVLTRAHGIVIVSTPTLSALRGARTLLQEIKKVYGGQGRALDLVINMVGLAPGKEVSKGDIRTAMDCDAAVQIPFDPKLFIGLENEGRRLTADKAGADIVAKILPLIQKLIARDSSASAENGASGGLLGGVLGKLKKR